MSNEDWVDISGYEGLYQVSPLGKVRSLDRSTDQLNAFGTRSKHTYKGRVLKPRAAKNGYLYVHLCKEGRKATKKIHRLVAETLIPREEVGLEVNHCDGNKLNNRVSNLEWCTSRDNKLHAISTGLKSNPFGITAHSFKGKVYVYKDGILINTLCGTADIRRNGFTPCGVSEVLTGRSKTHRGCYFTRNTTDV